VGENQGTRLAIRQTSFSDHSMRYRLLTLLILMPVGPPLLAWTWVHGREKEQWGYVFGAFLVGVAASLIVLVWKGELHWSILEDRRR